MSNSIYINTPTLVKLCWGVKYRGDYDLKNKEKIEEYIRSHPNEFANNVKRFNRWAEDGLIPGAILGLKKHHNRFDASDPRLQKFIDDSEWNTQREIAIKRLADYKKKQKSKSSKQHFANKIPLIQQFYNKFTSFRQDLKKVFRDTPKDQWTPVQHQKFLDETEWLVDEYQHSKEILKTQTITSQTPVAG